MNVPVITLHLRTRKELSLVPASLGTKIYVTNNISNTVSIIDTSTHSVTGTVNVGVSPKGIKALGSKLYVANFGSNYGGQTQQGTVSVIDTANSNSVSTINVGSGPRGVAVNGTDVYVANFNDNTVSRIDTANSNSVTTMSVGASPRGILSLNNKIYVENYQDGTISIIDGTTHAVTGPYKVGNTPSGMAAVGNNVAISRFTDDVVSIFDTTNLELQTPTPADTTPPVISSVASSTTQTTATITWSTDEAATSTLNFGTTISYGTATTSSSATTSHSYTLTSLTPSTQYHFQISVTDGSGNLATSTDYTFTTSAVVNSGGGSGGSSGSSGGSTAYATSQATSRSPSSSLASKPLTSFVNAIINYGITPGFKFNNNLSTNTQKGSDVQMLQKFLNAYGIPVARVGAGSPGHESTHFGVKTKNAVKLFQIAKGIKPANGLLGPQTRKAINTILDLRAQQL
jgi:YVTN family beta-propeller protein